MSARDYADQFLSSVRGPDRVDYLAEILNRMPPSEASVAMSKHINASHEKGHDLAPFLEDMGECPLVIFILLGLEKLRDNKGLAKEVFEDGEEDLFADVVGEILYFFKNDLSLFHNDFQRVGFPKMLEAIFEMALEEQSHPKSDCAGLGEFVRGVVRSFPEVSSSELSRLKPSKVFQHNPSSSDPYR